VNVPDTYFFKASTDRVINLIASVPVTYWAKKRPTHWLNGHAFLIEFTGHFSGCCWDSPRQQRSSRLFQQIAATAGDIALLKYSLRARFRGPTNLLGVASCLPPPNAQLPCGGRCQVEFILCDKTLTEGLQRWEREHNDVSAPKTGQHDKQTNRWTERQGDRKAER